MKILFYFVHNPSPPKSGAHHRCLQVLRQCRAAGLDMIFASSTLHTEQPWTEESKKALREITGNEVYIFEGPTRLEAKIDKWERRFRRHVLKKNGVRESIFCPYSLIRWFNRLVAKTKADAIMSNYLWFDQLVDHKRWSNKRRIMDTYDLVSVNREMQVLVQKQLARYAKDSDSSKFREEFNEAKKNIRLDPEELEVFRKYDTILAISDAERIELQPLLTNRIIYVPYLHAPSHLKNAYNGPPILSLGPNPFNEQGFIFFREVILPKILRSCPDFSLIVTGSLQAQMSSSPGIDWRGFVPDRDKLFEEAAYAICPVFAGTGQQIKILEAMAHGLVPVLFAEAAKNPLIRTGVNALVANSPEEFAAHVVSLEKNPDLRAALGQAAKAMISEVLKEASGMNEFAESLGVKKREAKPAMAACV